MPHMVFDVESIGLHGEAFAVGYVVMEDDGEIIDVGSYSCPPDAARGNAESREWVKANIPPLHPTHETPADIRRVFWSAYRTYKSYPATLWADCAWPVEARFLIACIEDDHANREWAGPYPLHEIATLALARGIDPLATYERLPDELPQHNPLCDARQSARLLAMLLKGIKPEEQPAP